MDAGDDDSEALPEPTGPVEDAQSEPDSESDRFWETDHSGLVLAKEIAISIAVVLLLAGLLFALSGVWPPLVAVESDSMEPRIMTGDLVFVTDTERFVSDGAIESTGVVPADIGDELDHDTFDDTGDVIVYQPNGDDSRTPIIHRAMLWVESGEDWSDRADPARTGGTTDCDRLANCPAPHDGFITQGDNNLRYDQVRESTAPIKPEWIQSRAHLRIPWLGNVRLILDQAFALLLGGTTVTGVLAFRTGT